MPVVQPARVEDAFHAIQTMEKMPAVVSLCRVGRRAQSSRPLQRAAAGVMRRGLGKMPAGPGLRGCGRLARARHRQQIGIRCCTLARLSDACTTRLRLSSSNLLVVARAVRPSNAVRTETDVIFFRDVLVDGVVGEAGQGDFPP